jgi:hypothetical protein
MAERKKKAAASQPEANGTETTPPAAMDASSEERFSQGEQAQRTDWASRTNRDELSNDEPDRRSTYPDPNVPFSIAHHNEAGLQLRKFDRFKQVQLAFASPISGDVEGRLVAAGWRYRPEEKVYTKQFGENGAAAAIVEAKRLYDELVEKLLDEKGIVRSSAR